MTLVIGTVVDGVGTIIADTCVSFDTTYVESHAALKTGRLFPGCLFGLSGDAHEGLEFVRDVRCWPFRSLQESWTRLSEQLSRKQFVAEFQLLLCSRHRGTPELFVLNSNTRTIIGPLQETTVIGSGSTLVKRSLQHFEDKIFAPFWQAKTADGRPGAAFPYLYCLWLTERSRGDEYSVWAKAGVGGLFHFLCQNRRGEYAQKPAVYLLPDYSQPTDTVVYLFRVSRLPEGLCLRDSAAGDVFIPDLVENSDFIGASLGELTEIGNQVFAREERQEPFYFFLGVGHPNATWRSIFAISMKANGKPSLIDWNTGSGPPSAELFARLTETRDAAQRFEAAGEAEDATVLFRPPETQLQASEFDRYRGEPCIGLRFSCTGADLNKPSVTDHVLVESFCTEQDRFLLCIDRFGNLAFRVHSNAGSVVLRLPVELSSSTHLAAICGVARVGSSAMLAFLTTPEAQVAHLLHPSSPFGFGNSRTVSIGCGTLETGCCALMVKNLSLVFSVPFRDQEHGYFQKHAEASPVVQATLTDARTTWCPLFDATAAGTQRAEGLIRQASLQTQNQELNAAITTVERALREYLVVIDPERVRDCYEALVVLHCRRGNATEAASCLQRSTCVASQRLPNHKLSAEVGVLLLSQGLYSRGTRYLERAIREARFVGDELCENRYRRTLAEANECKTAAPI